MAKRAPKNTPKRGSKPPDPKAGKQARYAATVERSNRESRENSHTARDIAPCPEIQDHARRDAAFASLREFLERYFAPAFPLPWSRDQLAIIASLERIIIEGGQLAVAAPRGGGKTTIAERGLLWALATGRRRYGVIACATEGLAIRSLRRLKAELMRNKLLAADWPRAVYPFVKLEGQSRRCTGQHFEGAPTNITWQKNLLIFPTMPGPNAEASGAILQVCGLGAAIRGLVDIDPEGRTIRPDIVIADDPQTRESAASYVQTEERWGLLNGDLLGLAGPGRKLACMAAVTVIKPNDLADRLLDRERHPEWDGRRYRMVERWPDREDLWQEYGRIRAEGMRAGDGGRAGNEFYAAHRWAMDEGAVVSWPQRYDPDELSALQHAWNLRLKLGDEFWAEFQNEPVVPRRDAERLEPLAIAARCGGYPRGVAPPEVEKVVAAVDCGQECLWWLVAGFDEAFGCSILDYGAWPEQSARVFLARQASPSLTDAYPRSGGAEESVYAGLAALTDRLLSRTWSRTDGAVLPVSRIVVDSGWATDTVRLFARQSPHREKLQIAKGVGLGAKRVPMSDWQARQGERQGESWVLGKAAADTLRLLRVDTHAWKSRVADALTRPLGGKGIVTLFGDSPSAHELIAVHLASEFPTRVEAGGRSVDEWDRRPDRENHLWDCLILACVAASLEGLSPLAAVGGGIKPKKKRTYVSFAELQARRRDPRP